MCLRKSLERSVGSVKMIVATAGHIDHGKSALIKALSGVDTDRLPEEKARGISIDLGFAYLSVPDTPTIGFVDVPGHERFVRNMLAGVCAIDYVLLVVAADDGVMPQTREHLNIVNLLGVNAGIAVITKTDRVSAARVEEVRAQITELVQHTGLAQIACMACSAKTQLGIDALRDAVVYAAQQLQGHDGVERNFRYAIDRSFTIAGSGTVVTGTIFSSQVAVGDRLLLSPSGKPVRVRGIHQNGQSVTTAQTGERCALNLVGISVDECRRGDWVLAPVLHAPTTRVDVRLTVLPSETHSLSHWTPLHLHTGTTEVLARVSISKGGSVQVGATAHVQLVLETPIACLHGDHFIVRDQSAQRTIGGGIVLDPFAPARARHKERRQRELAALNLPETSKILEALLWCSSDTGVEVDRFALSMNLTQASLQSLLAMLQATLVTKTPRIALFAADATTLRQQILSALQAHHQTNPQEPGLSLKLLRQRCAPLMSAPIFQALLRGVLFNKELTLSGVTVALVSHLSTVHPADKIMWQKLEPTLKRIGVKALTLEALAVETGIKALVLNEFLHRKVKTGELYRVSSDRFYLRDTFVHFAKIAQTLASTSQEQTFIAAQFRDQVGVNRTLAIEILEVLDRLGVTQRVGDKRRLLKPIAKVFELGQD